MKKNVQFGGDTGTDADYQYEHDQLNELPDNNDTCTCAQRVSSQAGSESIGPDSELRGRCQRFTYDVDVDEDGPFIINIEKEPEE